MSFTYLKKEVIDYNNFIDANARISFMLSPLFVNREDYIISTNVASYKSLIQNTEKPKNIEDSFANVEATVAKSVASSFDDTSYISMASKYKAMMDENSLGSIDIQTQDMITDLKKQFEGLVYKGSSKVASNTGLLTSRNSVSSAVSTDSSIDLYGKLATQIRNFTDSFEGAMLLVEGAQLQAMFDNLITNETAGSLRNAIATNNSSLQGIQNIPDYMSTNGDNSVNQLVLFSMGDVKLHSCTLNGPQVYKTGTNEENDYEYRSIIVGSAKVDCEVNEAILKMPVTIS